ncbi:hypothetical protein ACLIYP_05595 [Streptomyces nanhaiensis]|uniref:hypothetical protein n=1 Tax=Streptomyces nanhaiensis TaxID=679319 RepID=UPI00399C9DAB
MDVIPAALWQHEVTVEPFEGSGAYGDVYGAPAVVACLLAEETRLVRAADGTDTVSSASYLAEPDHRPPPGSKVTLPDGRTTKVIRVDRPDGGSLPVPSNTQVFLE